MLAGKRPDGTRHYHVIPIGGEAENRQIHQEQKGELRGAGKELGVIV